MNVPASKDAGASDRGVGSRRYRLTDRPSRAVGAPVNNSRQRRSGLGINDGIVSVVRQATAQGNSQTEGELGAAGVGVLLELEVASGGRLADTSATVARGRRSTRSKGQRCVGCGKDQV